MIVSLRTTPNPAQNDCGIVSTVHGAKSKRSFLSFLIRLTYWAFRRRSPNHKFNNCNMHNSNTNSVLGAEQRIEILVFSANWIIIMLSKKKQRLHYKNIYFCLQQMLQLLYNCYQVEYLYSIKSLTNEFQT